MTAGRCQFSWRDSLNSTVKLTVGYFGLFTLFFPVWHLILLQHKTCANSPSGAGMYFHPSAYARIKQHNITYAQKSSQLFLPNHNLIHRPYDIGCTTFSKSGQDSLVSISCGVQVVGYNCHILRLFTDLKIICLTF